MTMRQNAELTREEWETIPFVEYAARSILLTEQLAHDVPPAFLEADLQKRRLMGNTDAHRVVLKVMEDFQAYCVRYIAGR